jgi:leucyl/phenylalanyl-tRNA--protein transferase
MASRETARDTGFVEITPEVLLKAYACGIFPMAESAEDPSIYWIEPDERGIIPLDRFHVPKRLTRTIRSDRYTVHVDRDIEAVIDGCASPAADRTRTWINRRIRSLYLRLAEIGHCHSVETYDGDTLVGGLYGVRLGRAFFGESMFHTARDASKVALVHLVARLRVGGFILLDTQVRPNRFGIVIGWRRWVVKIHHVGNDTRVQPEARRELLRLDGIDDHMPDGRQVRRKGGRQVIHHAIHLESLPFPVEVMMMGNGWIAGLGDEFGDGESQREVDRYGHRILNDEDFQGKTMRKFIQLFFEIYLEFINALRHLGRADIDGEGVVRQFRNFRAGGARILGDRPTA